MKPKILFALLPVCFLFTSITAQDFEGVVKLKNSAAEGVLTTFTIDGDLVLMEARAEEGLVKILTNTKTGIFYTLADTEKDKMAIKNDMNSPMMKMAAGQMKTNPDSMDDDVDVKVTGETKMISGYKCIKVIGSSGKVEGIAWIAKDLKLQLSDLFPMAKINAKEVNKKMRAALGVEGFVMEMHSTDKKTGEQFTMTAEVEEKSVTLDEAAILEGYEIMDMTNIMKIMQEAQGDPAKLEKLKEMMKKSMNK